MTAGPRARHARQYMLAEVGTGGQARLDAACVQLGAGDPRVGAVALAYLARAGVRIGDAGSPLNVADAAEVARVAAHPELEHAAAFLLGALAATAEIARITGAPARPIANVPALSGG